MLRRTLSAPLLGRKSFAGPSAGEIAGPDTYGGFRREFVRRQRERRLEQEQLESITGDLSCASPGGKISAASTAAACSTTTATAAVADAASAAILMPESPAATAAVTPESPAASATAAAVPKGKSPRRFVVGLGEPGGQRISHPRLAAGLPPDDRLGTLVTRGRFRVVGSPGGSGVAPAQHQHPRGGVGGAAPATKPRRFTLDTPAAAAAAAAQAAQASAAGSSAAAQQGGRGGVQQQAAAKVIDRTWLDPSLLDGLCGAAQACTLALKKEAPSGGGSNSPRGVAGGGGSTSTSTSSTSSSSSSLHILLNLLEARREALRDENEALQQHNRVLRTELKGLPVARRT